jgi:hypothetical protein
MGDKGLGVLTSSYSGNRKSTDLLRQATSKTKFGLNQGESRLKELPRPTCWATPM